MSGVTGTGTYRYRHTLPTLSKSRTKTTRKTKRVIRRIKSSMDSNETLATEFLSHKFELGIPVLAEAADERFL
jgi:hypothetical protein